MAVALSFTDAKLFQYLMRPGEYDNLDRSSLSRVPTEHPACSNEIKEVTVVLMS